MASLSFRDGLKMLTELGDITLQFRYGDCQSVRVLRKPLGFEFPGHSPGDLKPRVDAGINGRPHASFLLCKSKQLIYDIVYVLVATPN